MSCTDLWCNRIRALENSEQFFKPNVKLGLFFGEANHISDSAFKIYQHSLKFVQQFW